MEEEKPKPDANGLVWSDPPEQMPKGSIWPQLVRSLREKPGEWARLRVYPKPHSAASQRIQIQNRYGNNGEYEFVSRIIEEGGHKVGGIWGRYIGGK